MDRVNGNGRMKTGITGYEDIVNCPLFIVHCSLFNFQFSIFNFQFFAKHYVLSGNLYVRISKYKEKVGR